MNKSQNEVSVELTPGQMNDDFQIILIVNNERMGCGRLKGGKIKLYQAEIDDPQLVTDYVTTLIEEAIEGGKRELLLGHWGATRTITWAITDTK